MKWLIDLAQGIFYKEGEGVPKTAKSFSSWLNLKEEDLNNEIALARKHIMDQVKNLSDFVLAEMLAELEMEFSTDFSEKFQIFYKKVRENREKMENFLLEKLYGDPNYVPTYYQELDELKKKASLDVKKENDLWTIEVRGKTPYLVRIVDEVDRLDQVTSYLEDKFSRELSQDEVSKLVEEASSRFGLLTTTIEKLINEKLLEKKFAVTESQGVCKVGSLLRMSFVYDKNKVRFDVFDPFREIESKLFPFSKFMERKGSTLSIYAPYRKDLPLNVTSGKQLANVITKDFRNKSPQFLNVFAIAIEKIDEGFPLDDYLREISDDELRQELIDELLESGFLLPEETEVIDSEGNDLSEGTPTGNPSISGSGVFIEPAKRNKY